MLQQQLRQKDEDIAAKSAEIGELKERLADLEKLKQQQEQLLTMKDSELAAAQQRLAEARTAATPVPATPANTPTQAAQTGQPAREQQAAGSMPWMWGGLAFLGMALLAWLFVRRKPRGAQKPAPRRGFDSEALAASMVAPVLDEEPPQHQSSAAAGDATASATTVVDLADVPVGTSPRNDTPNWHSSRVKAGAVPPVVEPPQPRFVPVADAFATPAPKASAGQRMKLARAFLDIGDDHSAKELLRELLDDGDPAARTDAARMLRDLG
ncbi:MAG: hypothetical protein EOP93_22365 [Lysobacteraceae bacterium]|nr:MAG: hypothetical protein EOP93_22365 [Xanthomonadaceae bacterium]